MSSSGGGTWDLAGTASALFIDMSGGGRLDAVDLEVAEAQLDMSGGGSAELAVSDTIMGAASGGSVIVVQGDPEQNVSLSGGSTLTLE